eukprot:g14870.t1
MGGSWGQLSAAFSGFTSLSTIVRGRNDKWDQVLGACGAVSASRGGGHRCMGSLGISICTLTTMCALGRGHHEVTCVQKQFTHESRCCRTRFRQPDSKAEDQHPDDTGGAGFGWGLPMILSQPFGGGTGTWERSG